VVLLGKIGDGVAGEQQCCGAAHEGYIVTDSTFTPRQK
jgi:hypothetical protein